MACSLRVAVWGAGDILNAAGERGARDATAGTVLVKARRIIKVCNVLSLILKL